MGFGIQIIRTTIHEDSWTETLDLLNCFLDIIHDTSGRYDLPDESLRRMVIIMSHYLVEIMFWDTINKYLVFKNDPILKESYKKFKQSSFSKVIKIIPQEYTGVPFDFSVEPFQSLKILIKNRNLLIHNNSTEMIGTAEAAFHSAIKCSQKIWKHFFPNDSFRYEEWIKGIDLKSTTFQQSYNKLRTHNEK